MTITETTPTYYSLYKGICVNNVDPEGRSRITAVVPAVFGDGTTQTSWALPCTPTESPPLPKPGQGVWIGFEGGDVEHPYWAGVWSPVPIPPPPVTSVFGRTGALGAQAGDYTVGQVTGAAPISSIPVPASSVTGPDAFGSLAVVGTSAFYARQDHDHGLPNAPTVPSPATTVTGPDAFGALAAVGVSALYARQDHDHGLPASPTVPSPSGSVSGPLIYGVSATSGTGTAYSLGNHNHGLFQPLVILGHQGAPISTDGTFYEGQTAVDTANAGYTCTAGGTPGTWVSTFSLGLPNGTMTANSGATTPGSGWAAIGVMSSAHLGGGVTFHNSSPYGLVVPVAGQYHIDAIVCLLSTSSAHSIFDVGWGVNGSLRYGYDDDFASVLLGGGQYATNQAHDMATLAAGDRVELWCRLDNGSPENCQTSQLSQLLGLSRPATALISPHS